MFQQVVHKGGESETNFIKIFINAEYLEISGVKRYTEDHTMHTFLQNFRKVLNYSAQITSQKVQLKIEEHSFYQNIYLYLTYKLTI